MGNGIMCAHSKVICYKIYTHEKTIVKSCFYLSSPYFNIETCIAVDLQGVIIMHQLSKKLIFFTTLLANFVLASQLYAADDQNTSNPLLMKASDIYFHPAPGFPKGAQIVLIRGDLSKAEPYTIRLKLPDGYVIPSHWHATDEEVTVLSGTLNVGLGDKVDKSQSTGLTAGGYQVVPANAHHYVWSTGETVFQLDGMGPRTTTFVDPDEWAAMIKKSNQ